MQQRGFGHAGDTPRRRWKRLFCTASGLVLAGTLMLLEGEACSPAVTANPDEQSDNTIGAYCDQILPTFCAYAVDTCGSGTTQARCIVDARPICCQGACSRPARLVKDLGACLFAYAGGDGGLDEAGVDHEAGTGLPCNQVIAGLAPVECQEVVELLSRPGLTGPPPGLIVEASGAAPRVLGGFARERTGPVR